jgi:predicted membrane-bound dolichyl-phosphate-mannose-protein mannosyltransferase
MKEKRSMGLNIGSASIIMLFAVLCLTVLSALSLLSASSQMRLSRRAADVVSDYYAADLAASQIYEAVKAGDTSRVETVRGDGGVSYHYVVVIDKHQSLEVSLAEENGAVTVEQWKIIESGDWEPDDTLDLWGGD